MSGQFEADKKTAKDAAKREKEECFFEGVITVQELIEADDVEVCHNQGIEKRQPAKCFP